MEVFYVLINVVIFNKVDFGFVVVIDVNIGEVLVMVNYFIFNFNNWVGIFEENFCNWVISDIFESGLMVKLMVVMIVLECYIVKFDVVLDIYFYILSGYFIKDVVFYLVLLLIGVL